MGGDGMRNAEWTIATGGTETRSKNITIRYWERTS